MEAFPLPNTTHAPMALTPTPCHGRPWPIHEMNQWMNPTSRLLPPPHTALNLAAASLVIGRRSLQAPPINGCQDIETSLLMCCSSSSASSSSPCPLVAVTIAVLVVAAAANSSLLKNEAFRGFHLVHIPSQLYPLAWPSTPDDETVAKASSYSSPSPPPSDLIHGSGTHLKRYHLLSFGATVRRLDLVGFPRH